MPISILLAEDHDILRESLRQMLESHKDLRVVAEAADGAKAVELAERLVPDVAVLDIGMKKLNGLEAAAHISLRCPHTAILMLTVYGGPQYVVRAVQAGARGYLLKESLEDEDLVCAIRTVHTGGRFFSPAVAGIASAVSPPE